MGKDLSKVNNTIFICNGGSCKKKGAEDITTELRCAIKMAGIHETTHTIKSYCMGQCESAPVLFIEGVNTWYKNVGLGTIDELLALSQDPEEGLSAHELFKRGWDHMKPTKVITPKTSGSFEWGEDPSLGRIHYIKIYPWEFNTYPLLKEFFTRRWPGLSIFLHKTQLKGHYQIKYQPGRALISDPGQGFSEEIVMKAPKDSPQFPIRVLGIKLFHDESQRKYGIHFSNQSQGVFLEVYWSENQALWKHLVENYARISA